MDVPGTIFEICCGLKLIRVKSKLEIRGST